MRHNELKVNSREQVYFPFAQQADYNITIVARTAHGSGDPHEHMEAIRARVAEIDPLMPLAKVSTMDEYVDKSLTSTQFITLVLTAFSGVALLLASLGLYGVLSYQVRRRTREFGIRMALGASPRRLWRQIIRHGLVLTLLGILIGLPLAFAIAQLIAGLLFDVSPADPLIYASITTLFLIVAFLACLIPARRAMKVDPMTALRCE